MMDYMRDQTSIDLANEIAALLEAKADVGQAQTALAIANAMLPALKLPLVRDQEASTK